MIVAVTERGSGREKNLAACVTVCQSLRLIPPQKAHYENEDYMMHSKN
jgi:hypothetical protein